MSEAPGSAVTWDSAALRGLADSLADLVHAGTGVDPGGASLVGDDELLARLSELERVKAVAAAAQARVTAVFAASQERAGALARAAAKGEGFEAWRRARAVGTGVADQVALARRLSPWQGGEQVGLAAALTTDLPCTLAALAAGALSEWRATLIARETSWLSADDRTAVDAEVASDPAVVGGLGNRELVRRVRAAAYRRDPHGAVERARAAEGERNVTIRPKPDAMCRVSALLPMAQGIAAYATLSRDADSARAAGDPRSRGQVMADTLVERVTGQATASAVPVEVQVVLSAQTLLATGPGAGDPAQVPGYGSVPAGWARDRIRGRDTDTSEGAACDDRASAAQVWLRRLFATPDGSSLVAMESSRRLFDAGLRRFLITRDDTCRTPWCDAPIRHLDLPYWLAGAHQRGPSARAQSGATSARNGQGLCERCNQAKEQPGWAVTVVDDPDGRAGPHRTRITTPTGATYESQAPPLLPSSTPPTPPHLRLDVESPMEHALVSLFAA